MLHSTFPVNKSLGPNLNRIRHKWWFDYNFSGRSVQVLNQKSVQRPYDETSCTLNRLNESSLSSFNSRQWSRHICHPRCNDSTSSTEFQHNNCILQKLALGTWICSKIRICRSAMSRSFKLHVVNTLIYLLEGKKHTQKWT